MKVYIVCYEHGEYSDYEAGVIKVCATKELAQKVIEGIAEYKEEMKAYTDVRLADAKSAGMYDIPYVKRKAFIEAWDKANPQPVRPFGVLWPSYRDDYFPITWAMKIDIVEAEVDE